ncbi:hypothetical protein E2562_039288 [Oryza meyeriana var. granulata]|uniref:Uncharacterized protein n=1 Tax=Oryza meyeriana var. granulata TaxID=110450 RepID=A0A6G1DUS8_9ORYZ|nr:hypothetical protein E2562_039288 [Oryza meyeriana var. granulata]
MKVKPACAPELRIPGLFGARAHQLQIGETIIKAGLGDMDLNSQLERFLDKAKLSPDYFIADCEDMLTNVQHTYMDASATETLATCSSFIISNSNGKQLWSWFKNFKTSFDIEEKVAAIVDELPLGLYDKYLFCLRPHTRMLIYADVPEQAELLIALQTLMNQFI